MIYIQLPLNGRLLVQVGQKVKIGPNSLLVWAKNAVVGEQISDFRPLDRPDSFQPV